jgi:hypothetical protein
MARGRLPEWLNGRDRGEVCSSIVAPRETTVAFVKPVDVASVCVGLAVVHAVLVGP